MTYIRGLTKVTNTRDYIHSTLPPSSHLDALTAAGRRLTPTFVTGRAYVTSLTWLPCVANVGHICLKCVCFVSNFTHISILYDYILILQKPIMHISFRNTREISALATFSGIGAIWQYLARLFFRTTEAIN